MDCHNTNATTATEEIQKSMLQVVGICTRLNYKQYDVQYAVCQIMEVVSQVEKSLKTINEQHHDKTRIILEKNKELAKQNHALKNEMNQLKEEIVKTKEELDNSQASFNAIFNEENLDDDNDQPSKTDNKESQELF
ncbi:PREDICTED: uncharacterized protein LOC106811750 [Priapulus caudatus]|uniref:Uncharacterized protein LOC106811750 n=1 Tax=Priapulus caudatus TaxID=37621 RepID=A0ABM1EFI3_PRICU|nr:PREDICTED: uncharacterized protein LOC106811750 [Priapulus caudatus]